jgi:hypothetical protein
MTRLGARAGRFFGASATQPSARYASTFGIAVGGAAFIAFGLAFFSALVSLWPVVEPTSQATKKFAVTLGWGAYTAHVDKSTGLLLLALLMGAIGGYVHAATSFVSYIGNRQFKASWGWWYALRALIGAALALLAYVALRGGFLTGNSTTTTANIDAYGVATVSGLVGLFSKQATDKLEEVFNTAFRTGAGIGDAQRKDSITPEAPTINALDPASFSIANPKPIAIKGAGFNKAAVVKLDGTQVPATRRSESQIDVGAVPPALALPGAVRVTVMNPDEGTSPAVELQIVP